MELASDILKDFAKVVINESNTKTKTETTVYATIVESDNKFYAKIDGSDRLTPINTTAAVKDGERVTVMIKNHSAVVTGNLTSPSASNSDVKALDGKVTEFEHVMAHSITTDDLNALNANINNIKAITADVEELEAVNAQIESLEAMFAELEYVDATNIDAVNAEIEKLEATFADVTDLSAEELEAVNAEINNLKAYTADFTYVSAEKLEAMQAQIKSLDVENLDAAYANIDFSNIGEAAMEYFYAESGLIKNVTVGDATITGELVGVTIRGDRLIGGTVIADKLVIQGEDGLYYKLNFDGGDFLEGEEVPTDSLHGSVITANSITAEKISVEDLVAFDATIGGFNITENSLYSGVKESVDNTTRGVYLDNDGQVAFGDATNFIKYYKDEETDTYKLAIAADSVTIGGGEMSTISEQLSLESDDINIAGNRLTIESDNFTLDADGSVTCDDITITGGQVDVIAETGYQSKVSVTSADNTQKTTISPLQINMEHGAYFTQLNSLTGGGYYALESSNGSRITRINPASLSVGVSATSSTAATYFTANSTGAASSGYMRAAGELQSTTANGLRLVQGNYGFFIRNDGSSTYLMLTDSGDQYGSYNSLRPLTINNSTGAVTMGNGLTVNTLTSTGSTNVNGTAYLNGGFRPHANGTAIKFMRCGTTVVSLSGSSIVLLSLSTIQGWYSGAGATNTAILVSNGDGSANGTHVQSVTYQSSNWYLVVDKDTVKTGSLRVNYTVICW